MNANEKFCRQHQLPAGTRLAVIKHEGEAPIMLSENPTTAIACMAVMARGMSRVKELAPDIRSSFKRLADDLLQGLGPTEIAIVYEDEVS